MNENGYKVINNKGCIHKETIDNKEYLCFNNELRNSLSEADLLERNDILNSKLEMYYSQVSNVGRGKDEIELNVSDIIDHIHKHLTAKGYIYSYDSTKNFYISKKLCYPDSISGIGKSKIVRLFAEAIGANVNSGRYKMITAKPDWNDDTELFGYKNVNDEFTLDQLIEIIKEATEDWSMPYFVCIDEMNLARVLFK